MDLDFDQAIFIPPPGFDPDAALPNGREERLHAILRNLDEHHAQVRRKIMALGTARSKTLANKAVPTDPSNAGDIPHLISSLEAPYRQWNVDPAVPPGDYPLPRITSTTGSGSGHMQLARQTLRALQEYDVHAAKTRAYYENALKRTGAPVPPVAHLSKVKEVAASPASPAPGGGEPMQSVVMTSDPTLRRVSTAGMAVASPVSPATASGDVDAVMYDRARDPRLRR